VRKLQTHLLAWKQAQRAATAAERRIFLEHGSGASAPTAHEIEDAKALRARASELLLVFLDEMRALAAANER